MEIKVKVPVLICDDVPDTEGEVFEIDGVELPGDPVRVSIGFDMLSVVGMAMLRKEGNTVMADITLMKEIPPGMIATIGGEVLEKTKQGDVTVLNKTRITEIALTLTPSDIRLPELKL